MRVDLRLRTLLEVIPKETRISIWGGDVRYEFDNLRQISSKFRTQYGEYIVTEISPMLDYDEEPYLSIVTDYPN